MEGVMEAATVADELHESLVGVVDAEEESLHKKFVKYIQALSGNSESRSSVWMEHSYARAWRAGGGPASGGAAPRTLLVTRAPPCSDCHLPGEEDEENIDVEVVEKAPEPPLSPEQPPTYEQALTEEDVIACTQSAPELDWEEKLESLAPSPVHRRLAATTLELIRSLRMSRLAGSPRSAKAHARKLRRALATLWNYPGPQQQRPAAWMHGVLSAYLPRPYFYAYNDMLAEMQRTVPHLVDRLMAGYVPTAAPEAEATGPRVPPAADVPLLVWMPSGRDKRDARWERRLKHLMAVFRIKAPHVSVCSPEAWCSAVATTARSTLQSVAGLPRSALVLGGWGAGAALAIHVASQWDPSAGPPPKALVLLAPPLLTAEGPRDSMDDPIMNLKIPMLFVVGQNAMQCSVNMAEETRARMGSRCKLVVVGSGDDALRLSHRKRCMERVTQQMVDAALAEEVCGFVTRAMREPDEPCEEPPAEDAEPTVARRRPADERQERQSAGVKRPRHSPERSPTPPSVSLVVPAGSATPGTPNPTLVPGKGRGLALLRVSSAPQDGGTVYSGRRSTEREEKGLFRDSYSNQPDSKARNVRVTDMVSFGPVTNGGSNKSSPHSGGVFSVVSRGTGSTPLALPLPRRVAGASPVGPATHAALAPADIMELPIVFADDDKLDVTEEPPRQPLVTVSKPSTPKTPTGSMGMIRSELKYTKYTKVILAKRPPGQGQGQGAPGGPGGSGARPIIVKGGMKLLPGSLGFITRAPGASPVTSPQKPPSQHDKKSPV